MIGNGRIQNQPDSNVSRSSLIQSSRECTRLLFLGLVVLASDREFGNMGCLSPTSSSVKCLVKFLCDLIPSAWVLINLYTKIII